MTADELKAMPDGSLVAGWLDNDAPCQIRLTGEYWNDYRVGHADDGRRLLVGASFVMPWPEWESLKAQIVRRRAELMLRTQAALDPIGANLMVSSLSDPMHMRVQWPADCLFRPPAQTPVLEAVNEARHDD